MKNYDFHNQFVLRTPMRPYLGDLSFSQIKEIVSQKKVQEAIFLASPVLHSNTMKWLNGELKKEKVTKLVASIYKYLIRLHTRCTPFGLFAGCLVGNWGIENQVELDEQKYTRHTRLDMNFLCALAQHIENDLEIRPHLLYSLNSSIHRKHNFLHYTEYYYINNQRQHRLNTVDVDDYLKIILTRATDECTVEELCQELLKFDTDFSKEEVMEYIHSIIDAQILTSNLQPTITGKGLIYQIINVLSPIAKINKTANKFLNLLSKIEDQLNQLDSNSENTIKDYQKIIEVIKETEVPYEISKLFQTDSYKSGTTTLSKRIQPQLKECFNFLKKISPPSNNNKLTDFINAFYSRYEDREIPLLDALDTQLGIGFPANTSKGNTNPLIKDIVTPKSETVTNVQWNNYEKFIFNLILKNRNSKSIDFSKVDVSSILIDDNSPMADTISCMFRLLKDDKILLKSIGGTSSINLLGRFGYGSKEIKSIIDELVDFEEQVLDDQAILAEIIHLPESRTGNILAHPSFRKYEIPYLCKSTKNKDFQISLSDLLISVNPSTKKITLRSKKLNKRIIPRLSNAHNYSFKSLPIYHFLCEIQLSNQKGGLRLNLGPIHSSFDHIPRITWKNIILERATWYVNRNQYKNITASQIQAFKTSINLPDKVVLGDGDNELLFDLSNELSTEIFLKEINKRSGIKLIEFIEPSNSIKDIEGKVYTNEIISFLKNTTLKKKTNPINFPSINKYPTNLFLGSKWLYFKIYTGTSILDRVISETLFPSANHLIEKKAISEWFFIRYNDPHSHIRFRLKIEDTSQFNFIINYLHNQFKPLVEHDIVYNIQTDTYKPELLRYGKETIVEAEQWFMYDSIATSQMIDLIGGVDGETVRWLYAIRAVDEMLNNFHYSIDEKRNLLKRLKTNFATEFNVRKLVRKQLNAKYNNFKSKIFQTLDRDYDNQNSLKPLFDILEDQKINSQKCIAKIIEKTTIPLDNLLSSFIHMCLNRIFNTQQRKCEMVIYDFMYQYYTTQIFLLQQKEKNESL